MPSLKSPDKIIIVGAGPVGLFLALKLGQAGLRVEVIEREGEISTQPRAAGYYGGALLALAGAGVLDLIVETGYLGNGLAWRRPPTIIERPDGQKDVILSENLAILPFTHASTSNPENGMVILPQSKLCECLLERAEETGNVTIRYNTEMCTFEDLEDEVRVEVKSHIGSNSESNETIYGSFLVGADGGSSRTRKLLGIGLPGHSGPERLVATEAIVRNTNLPEFPAHFVVDPVNYAVLIPLTPPKENEESLWRCTVAVDPHDTRTDEEILEDEHIGQLYDKVMEYARPLEYRLTAKSVFRPHQRCSSSMRRGRVALAGDAAHLNSVFGAMGTTTGLQDAEALADCLRLIFKSDAPLSILDIYSDERRKVFQFFVDPHTTQNKLRLQNYEQHAEEDWFYRMLKNPTEDAMKEYFEPFMTVWRTDIGKLARQRGLIA